MMCSSALYQFLVCQWFCNDFITHELLLVVNDAQDQGAAGAGGHVLAVLQVLPGDEEAVPAGARVAVGLGLLIVLEVLDLHLIVEHRHGAGRSAGTRRKRRAERGGARARRDGMWRRILM